MLSGELVDDREMIQIVDSELSKIDTSQEFIIDGFPRTHNEARWLLDQVKDGRLQITAVIHLVAPEPVVLKRLMQRGRPDDVEPAIRRRFVEYAKATRPILTDFKDQKVTVYDIDATDEPNKVHAKIAGLL
jgi:adenylate kinase